MDFDIQLMGVESVRKLMSLKLTLCDAILGVEIIIDCLN